MDYCYTCRRTLNGVLVCPGCGAYAPDVDPNTGVPGGRFDGMHPTGDYFPPGSGGFAPPGDALTGYAPAGYSAQAEYIPEPYIPAPYVPAGFVPDPLPAVDEAPAGSVLGPVSIAPTLHRGRAARRRQMDRWKKSRRRAGVATAFALFGGGVTVASMQAGGAHKGGTAAASSYDNTVTPVTLSVDTSAGGPSSSTQHNAPAPAHHTASVPQQRTGVGAQALPTGQATHPVTDNGGTIPMAGGPSSVQAAYAQPAPSTTTAPPSVGNPGTTTSPGTGSTKTQSGTSTGSGSTATTPPPTSSPTTPPATTPPPTTAPTPPPPHQGLCVLILCIG
jgi:hypothetical protein